MCAVQRSRGSSAEMPALPGAGARATGCDAPSPYGGLPPPSSEPPPRGSGSAGAGGAVAGARTVSSGAVASDGSVSLDDADTLAETPAPPSGGRGGLGPRQIVGQLPQQDASAGGSLRRLSIDSAGPAGRAVAASGAVGAGVAKVSSGGASGSTPLYARASPRPPHEDSGVLGKILSGARTIKTVLPLGDGFSAPGGGGDDGLLRAHETRIECILAREPYIFTAASLSAACDAQIRVWVQGRDTKACAAAPLPCLPALWTRAWSSDSVVLHALFARAVQGADALQQSVGGHVLGVRDQPGRAERTGWTPSSRSSRPCLVEVESLNKRPATHSAAGLLRCHLQPPC
jgi:hypothetical protein